MNNLLRKCLEKNRHLYYDNVHKKVKEMTRRYRTRQQTNRDRESFVVDRIHPIFFRPCVPLQTNNQMNANGSNIIKEVVYLSYYFS